MNIKRILVLLFFAAAIAGIIAPVSATESVNKDKVYSVESKEKSVKYKVTWNANGGKIGNKKTVTTNVNKGSKLGTLPKTTRPGYELKGWYTKKTGGTKINKNTKPKKNIAYYAQWKALKWKKLGSGNFKDNISSYISYSKGTEEVTVDFYVNFKKNKTKAGTLFISKTGNNIKTYILDYKGNKTTSSNIISKKNAKEYYNVITDEWGKQGILSKSKEIAPTEAEVKALRSETAKRFRILLDDYKRFEAGETNRWVVLESHTRWVEICAKYHAANEAYNNKEKEDKNNQAKKNTLVGTWKFSRGYESGEFTFSKDGNYNGFIKKTSGTSVMTTSYKGHHYINNVRTSVNKKTPFIMQERNKFRIVAVDPENGYNYDSGWSKGPDGAHPQYSSSSSFTYIELWDYKLRKA